MYLFKSREQGQNRLSAAVAMSVEPSRFGPEFHRVTVSRDVFEVRSHYVNLRPVGGGSYGIVCSAEDTVRVTSWR